MCEYIFGQQWEELTSFCPKNIQTRGRLNACLTKFKSSTTIRDTKRATTIK